MTADQALRGLLLGTYVFAAALALLFLYLLGLKIAFRRRQSELAHWTQRFWNADPSAYDAGRPTRLFQRRRAFHALRNEALQQALYRRSGVFRGKTEQRDVSRFAERHLTDFYRRQLRSRSRGRRLATLRYMEQLKMSTLLQETADIVRHPRVTDEERFAAVRVFAALDRAETITFLLEAGERFSDFQCLQILNLLSSERLQELIRSFDALPPRFRLLLVDALRIRNERSEAVLALLERSAESEDGELRIRALKALANFGYMSAEGVAALLSRIARPGDVRWEERLTRAKAMGSVREPPFLAHLETLLSDPVYLVRQQAALSIAQYKGGLQRLERLAAEHPDRYAREMAKEIIERVRYERDMD